MIYLKGTLQAEFHATYYGRSEVQSRTAAAGLFFVAREGYYQEIEIPAAIIMKDAHTICLVMGGCLSRLLPLKSK